MKEKISVGNAFDALGMAEILRESREADGQLVGNQRENKNFIQRRDHLNPHLSKKERRSRRNRDKGRR